jgi:steroid delta-isomerase-like uncharacterized protein
VGEEGQDDVEPGEVGDLVVGGRAQALKHVGPSGRGQAEHVPGRPRGRICAPLDQARPGQAVDRRIQAAVADRPRIAAQLCDAAAQLVPGQRSLGEEAEYREFQHEPILARYIESMCTSIRCYARTMPSQSTESVMNRFVEFINTGNEDLAREVISPAAVFHAPTHPEPLRGPDGYMDVISTMRSAFPDVRWTLEETVTEGDTVAARFTMRGTHDGEFFGIPASGKKISVQAMNFYYLADGRIIGERGQPDLLGVMQQIGALPAP